MRSNFYVSEAATLEGVAAGIEWLQDQVGLGITTACLIAVTRAALEGMIGEVVGAENAKALAKGNALRLGNGYLLFYTEKQLPTVAKGAAILLVHPSEKLLNKVDNLRDAASLAVIPWLMDEIAHWVRHMHQKIFSANSRTHHNQFATQWLRRQWNQFG